MSDDRAGWGWRRLLGGLCRRIHRRLPIGVPGAVARSITRSPGYPVAYNVNRSRASTHGRRALLLYRITPFLLDDSAPELVRHHNMRRGPLIAELLDARGYIVDAASGRDAKRRRPPGRYDLVISDRADLEGWFPADAQRLFLATTTGHSLHNANLRRRHERLTERGRPPVRIRRVYGEAVPYARSAHAIVAVGNEFTTRSWRGVTQQPVYAFNNHGFPDTECVTEGKDFSEARHHFLFYAGRSQVQKGLDLLLEVFPRRPELHLYVCGSFESEADFCAAYRTELYGTPNVHPIGWVQADGPEFRELARRCAYLIHPSCSDGQAGAVVHGMHAGLIPMVTRETGIDPADVAVTFTDDSLEAIEGAVVEVARRPTAWHASESHRTRRIAETRYSEAAFRQHVGAILDELLDTGAPRIAGQGSPVESVAESKPIRRWRV